MRAPLLLGVLFLAGCASPAPPGTPEGARDEEPLATFLVSTVAAQGSEPTVGFTAEGVLFVGGGYAPSQGPVGSGNVGREAVYRSTDGGATWEDVLAGAGVQRPPADFDPWVWVDRDTGRVFDAPLYVGCSWLAWSDDDGATWEGNPGGGCGLPGHDHQHLTTGPPARGVTTQGYPNVVYYAYNSLRPGTTPVPDVANPVFGSKLYEGTAVSVSLDGGKTFGLPVLVRPQDPCAGGNDGPVAVARDGTAYVAMPSCEGIDVAVSRDSGATWEPPVPVGDVPAQLGAAMDPSVAVDEAGNAYVVYEGDDDRVYLALSRDAGRSWSRPVAVEAPPVKAAVFAVLQAGAPGRLALAYLGTDSDPATWPSTDPSDAPDEAVWHLYAAWSDDALAATPTFRTQRVTPEDDPVQRGCIWTRGGAHPCRNLKDFIGMAQHEGRVAISYVDGCDACGSAAASRDERVVVALQQTGPSLLARTG